MLDIEHEKKDAVTVVYFMGKMDTRTSPEAEKYVNGLLDEGETNVLMNFEDLDFISSTGLRVILSTGKKLMASNGKLTMCSPNITVNDVLKMSGFNQMFGVFETEEEALASY
ncbi:MAG TPA: STAS domain-containing protein [Anaerolineae bacterium]|nr:STAS domain-containing protein [Anaerolineae bacterium]